MELIVLVDRNWAIGYQGDQIVRIKQDLARFRELTADSVVIFGRKTLATFPGGRPLPGRENWLLTRNPDFRSEGVEVFHSLEAVLAKAAATESSGKKVFVIGGTSVYEQLLPYCRAAEVTMADHEWPADVYFPDLTENPNWVETARSETYVAGTKTPFPFQFVRFENLSVCSY